MKDLIKYIWGAVMGLILCVGLILLTKKCQKEPAPTHIDTIQDSILYHAEKEKTYTDSAKIHHEAWEKAWQKYIDTSDIKSAHWDTLRANYKRALEAKIRAGLIGLGDSVRSPETNNLSPANGKSSFVKSQSGTSYPDGF